MAAPVTLDTEVRQDGHFGPPGPIAEPHRSAWGALTSAHAALSGRLQEALVEADLPPLPWYQVLNALASAPEERMRMGELAEILVISRGGLTKLVDRLVKAGLLERALCETDRRVSYATLLPAGAEMLTEMEPIIAAELERAFVATLSPGQAEALRDALTQVRSSACSVA